LRELIGVRGLHNITVEDLKRDFLIFDKIFIVGLKEYLIDINKENSHKIARPYIEYIIYDFYRNLGNLKNIPEYIKYMTNEFEWLLEKNKLILDYHDFLPDFRNLDIKPHFEVSKKISDFALNYSKNITNLSNFDYSNFISLIHELSIREKTAWINLNEDFDAYPIIENFSPIDELETKKHLIFKTVLNKFPIPDESTSWEQIFEFKEDSESNTSLLGLRNWVNDISKSNLNVKESEEKLEYLLQKYEKSIKLHKLKVSNSSLETVVVGGAELIENIAKLKLSKIAKKLFKAKKEQIELMEIELKSEGSELSYIIKTNKEFLT
jgi:hypothetical protein